MELTREQERRLQQLIDKCNKYSDDSLNIYEVMDTYKCYKDADDKVKDYIYEVVANALHANLAAVQNVLLVGLDVLVARVLAELDILVHGDGLDHFHGKTGGVGEFF